MTDPPPPSGHSLLPAMAEKASYAGEVFGVGAPARLIEAAAAGAGPGQIMADRL